MNLNSFLLFVVRLSTLETMIYGAFVAIALGLLLYIVLRTVCRLGYRAAMLSAGGLANLLRSLDGAFTAAAIGLAQWFQSLSRTTRSIILGVIALAGLEFAAMVFWPYEFVAALLGLILYASWASLVIAAFWIEHPVEAANRQIYHWPFGSNERRWVILLVLAVLYFFLCVWVGRGQPLIRGLEEGLVGSFKQVQTSQAYERSETVVTAFGKKWWKDMGMDEALNNIGVKPAPAPEPKTKERPFYGLMTWSHWFVFMLFYLPTLVIYGIAMWREELTDSFRRWKEKRAQRMQAQTKSTGTAQAETKLAREVHGLEWLVSIEGLIDLFEVVMHFFTHRKSNTN